MFVWTPPHFWALAMRYSGDYAAAGIPMLPVVRGPEETRKQILLYSLVLFGTSLLLVPFGDMGAVYGVAAAVLGGWFVWRALRLWRGTSPTESMRLFRFSIVYLALLFAAVAVDALVPDRPRHRLKTGSAGSTSPRAAGRASPRRARRAPGTAAARPRRRRPSSAARS